MSKVLVVYTSGTGCTEGVAEKIGETLAARGLQVDVKAVSADPKPDGYDAVFAGSGVRAGSWHPRAKKWMARNAAALRRMPLAFFTVCGCMMEGSEKADEAHGYTDKMIAATHVEPLDIGLFGGWYEPTKFSWIERKIMEFMKAPEGDFRDWDAIGEWASRVAPKLGV